MKVYIETYGCTFNQADSQIMAGLLTKESVTLVDNVDDADIIVVNTCYVKLPTESKITNHIMKLQEDYPSKKIIVSGCMVEIDPKKLDKIAPEASWIGPRQLNKTVDVVKSTMAGEVCRAVGSSDDSKVCLDKVRDDPFIHIIQICEGCLGSCTYCCTRFARGKLQSYPISDIVKEAKAAIDDGCVEIQLTAQDTAAFGKDTGEYLYDLINQVSSLDGDFRVRVGMMHPNNMMGELDELVDAFKSDKVYDFIHLPVQSGSDKVLSEMKRGHSIREYVDVVSRFKAEIPGITIATDIIVGYPTESEDDFQATCDLLEDVRPGIVHISKYMHRPKALSSSLASIDPVEMKRRSKIITSIKNRITEDENRQLLHTRQEVLVVEKGSKGGLIAKTNSYIPVVVSDGDLGSFMEVEITDTTGTYIIGN